MTDPPPTRLPDEEYRWMSWVLRGGLLASLTVMSAALVAYALTHPELSLADALATNPILQFLGLSGLAAGLARGDPAAYLTLGVIALVATPILRVATGFYYFRRGHERGMEAITLTVLVLLFVGLLVVGPIVR
jgi:uncharacterized membrane protein